MGVTLEVGGVVRFFYKNVQRFPTISEMRRLEFVSVHENMPQMETEIRRMLRDAKKFRRKGRVTLTIDPHQAREIRLGAPVPDAREETNGNKALRRK